MSVVVRRFKQVTVPREREDETPHARARIPARTGGRVAFAADRSTRLRGVWRTDPWMFSSMRISLLALALSAALPAATRAADTPVTLEPIVVTPAGAPQSLDTPLDDGDDVHRS